MASLKAAIWWSWGLQAVVEKAAPIMQLDQVGRVFGAGPAAIHALLDVSLQIFRGDYVSIMGPSGSGKSTLLNIMALLDRQTSGSYRFDGVDSHKLSESRRTGLRAHRIGFIFQAFHLLAHRDVTENVVMSMLYNRMPRSSRRQLALAALGRVGLSHRASFLPTKLSGGERQRVAIARAIAPQPTVLLCDEPTGNLDTNTGSSILDLFDELRADGLTIVVVTHDPRVGLRADRIVEVEDGRVETTSELTR